VFKGQGMEFSEVREYQPGDEVRTIDWNVSARMRRLFVKRYVEERELTVLPHRGLLRLEPVRTGERDKQSMARNSRRARPHRDAQQRRVGLILCSDGRARRPAEEGAAPCASPRSRRARLADLVAAHDLSAALD